MDKTLQQFDAVIERCKEVFLKKTFDYGTAWRILRPTSLTDQLLIKAKRIRSIQENKVQKVEDSIEGDFIGIVNYSVMALVQLSLPGPEPTTDVTRERVATLYDGQIAKAKELLLDKNHDYGEAWRGMRISSITDLILMKLLRLRQIEDNEGKTLVSEGPEANYLDIINYAVFALILMGE